MHKLPPMRRLPLAGCPNTRDLGGYPCNGGVMRWHTVLRSGSPSDLDEKGIQMLRDYGVECVIDLRAEDECERRPSPLEEAPGFAVHHVSMMDQMHATNFEGDLPGSMSGLYISMLDNNAAAIREVLHLVAGARQGALFHCAVGKDRTGVIAMLLLNLAGVADEDIVADYAVTDIYMREIFDETLLNAPYIPEYVLKSRPESMERVLAHLKSRYGSAERYLQQAGMPAGEIEALRKKLVDTGH